MKISRRVVAQSLAIIVMGVLISLTTSANSLTPTFRASEQRKVYAATATQAHSLVSPHTTSTAIAPMAKGIRPNPVTLAIKTTNLEPAMNTTTSANGVRSSPSSQWHS